MLPLARKEKDLPVVAEQVRIYQVMNDPHVEQLTYDLHVNLRYIEFEDPPALFREYDAFSINLENDLLTVKMLDHYASVEDAKQIVESFLKDWTIYLALETECDAIEFKFKAANVIDRNPSPQIARQSTAHLNITLGAVVSKATGTTSPIKRREYPTPPSRFKASPDVETLWHRYKNHLEEKEPYQALGYFCLSFMEWSTTVEWRNVSKNRREAAAKQYKTDETVLKKLADLTTTKGDLSDARKGPQGSDFIPLTDTEKSWIRATIKMLICRKGEYDFKPASATTLRQITMADLPQL